MGIGVSPRMWTSLSRRMACAKSIRNLTGFGCVAPFKCSKLLRDADNGVRIKFLVSGQFPGDGKPKPIAFPDPSQGAAEIDGIRYLQLERLIELKLASGMTNPARLRDLSDVQDLIRILKLPLELRQKLDDYVRAKYVELWNAIAEDSRQQS